MRLALLLLSLASLQAITCVIVNAENRHRTKLLTVDKNGDPIGLAQLIDPKDLENVEGSDDINLCKELSAIEKEDSSTVANKQPIVRRIASAVWQKAKSVVNKVVEPPAKYVTLIMKFRRWFNEYEQLRNETDANLPEPMDLLRFEFAHADSEIVEGLGAQRENIDMLHMIFTQTLERLNKLKVLYSNEETRPEAMDIFKSIKDEEAQRRYEQATDRLKRVTTKAASSFVQRELAVLARLMIINSLATVVADHPEITHEYGTAGVLASIVVRLGSAHTPLIASYLTNIKFRTAMYLLSPSKPLSDVVEACPMPESAPKSA